MADNSHFGRHDLVSVRILPNFELIRAISEMDIRYMKKCGVNRVNEKKCRSEKNQGNRGHRKVKCKINQASVMINLYVKFIVHSSYAKKS